MICEGMRSAVALPLMLSLCACDAMMAEEPQRSEMAFWRLQSDGAQAAQLCQAARAARAAWQQVLADPPTGPAPHLKYPASNVAYWDRRIAEACASDAAA